MVLIRFFLALCGMMILSTGFSQTEVKPKDPRAAPSRSPAEEYAWRIRQERLGEHYIPRDLNDAMSTLDKITSESSQENYISEEEDFVVKRLWFSFGRWLGTNWGLYEGSRFSVYLRGIGVDHPEGQIEFIMRAYHRHLQGKPLDVKDLALRYKAEKAEADSLKKSQQKVIETFTRERREK